MGSHTMQELSKCQGKLSIMEFSGPSCQDVDFHVRQLKTIQESAKWQQREVEKLALAESRISESIAGLMEEGIAPDCEESSTGESRTDRFQAEDWVASFFYTWHREIPPSTHCILNIGSHTYACDEACLDSQKSTLRELEWRKSSTRVFSIQDSSATELQGSRHHELEHLPAARTCSLQAPSATDLQGPKDHEIELRTPARRASSAQLQNTTSRLVGGSPLSLTASSISPCRSEMTASSIYSRSDMRVTPRIVQMDMTARKRTTSAPALDIKTCNRGNAVPAQTYTGSIEPCAPPGAALQHKPVRQNSVTHPNLAGLCGGNVLPCSRSSVGFAQAEFARARCEHTLLAICDPWAHSRGLLDV